MVTHYRPSLKDRTRYSSLTRIGTASWAVGATIRPGKKGSLPFFLSLSSTQTILPMSGSRSVSRRWAPAPPRSCERDADSPPCSPSSSSLLSSWRRRPRRPPSTGVPKCSGCVNGSWSSVSLSAKWRPLFKHSAVRRSVVMSPSSNTEHSLGKPFRFLFFRLFYLTLIKSNHFLVKVSSEKGESI